MKEEKVCESYEKYIGLMARVLGWEEVENGEGVLPFIRACYNYNEEKGSFSNWLWQNMVMHKRLMNYKKAKNQIELVSLEECVEIASNIDTASIVESREWLLKKIDSLSEDAKDLIRCVFEIQTPMKRRRTKFPTTNVATGTQVRVQLKRYCREIIGWSWPRYWAAVNEIREMLRSL